MASNDKRNPIDASRLEILEQARPDCRIYPVRINALSSYLEACIAVAAEGQRHWYRGHATARWSLTPSALRHDREQDRTEALALLDDFKRLSATKLRHVPPLDEGLQWAQIARHYGLPTRLLDWTQNAAIGLYFACGELPPNEDIRDGLVFLLDPVELNVAVDPDRPCILDANRDAKIIAPYLRLRGRKNRRGLRTVAVNPVWNSERILLQKGAFTLHGSRAFGITKEQASSLVALPVLDEDKEVLLKHLSLIGIDEMSIFPEPEHVCGYLRSLTETTS